jgi:hypothetical protein
MCVTSDSWCPFFSFKHLYASHDLCYPGAAPARDRLTHALIHPPYIFSGHSPTKTQEQSTISISRPIPSLPRSSIPKNPDHIVSDHITTLSAQIYAVRSTKPRRSSWLDYRVLSVLTRVYMRQSIRQPHAHDGGGQSLQPSRSPAATYVSLHRRWRPGQRARPGPG